MPTVVKSNVHAVSAIHLADIRPIILRVETEVQSNADAEVQSLALMNPTGEPVEIHEFKFTCRAKPNVPYVDNQIVGESVGVGDDVTTNFTHNAVAIPLIRGTVKILNDGVVVGSDDGAGNITGFDFAGTSTVDYDTGALNLDYNVAPVSGVVITMNYSQDAGLVGGMVSGGTVAVALKVAGHQMTNGPIPLWCFGAAYTLGFEEFAFTPSIVNPPPPPAPQVQTLTLGGHYRFKLDEPLYLPPGVAVEASLRSLGGFAGTTIVSIVASGSVLPHRPAPAKIKVPWVCVYNSKSFAFDEEGGDTSPETSLINPFDVPITIRRFVGRIAQITNDSGRGLLYVSDSDNPFSIVSNASTGGALGYYETVFKVRMRDSMGTPVVRGADFFRNVFDGKTRAWETNFKFPARQYYNVQVEKGVIPGTAYASFNGATYTPSTSRAQLQVSFVGWREESL